MCVGSSLLGSIIPPPPMSVLLIHTVTHILSFFLSVLQGTLLQLGNSLVIHNKVTPPPQKISFYLFACCLSTHTSDKLFHHNRHGIKMHISWRAGRCCGFTSCLLVWISAGTSLMLLLCILCFPSSFVVFPPKHNWKPVAWSWSCSQIHFSIATVARLDKLYRTMAKILFNLMIVHHCVVIFTFYF